MAFSKTLLIHLCALIHVLQVKSMMRLKVLASSVVTNVILMPVLEMQWHVLVVIKLLIRLTTLHKPPIAQQMVNWCWMINPVIIVIGDMAAKTVLEYKVAKLVYQISWNWMGNVSITAMIGKGFTEMTVIWDASLAILPVVLAMVLLRQTVWIVGVLGE